MPEFSIDRARLTSTSLLPMFGREKQMLELRPMKTSSQYTFLFRSETYLAQILKSRSCAPRIIHGAAFTLDVRISPHSLGHSIDGMHPTDCYSHAKTCSCPT